MRDMVADWKKWSRTERVSAVLVMIVMAAVPFGSMLAAVIGV